MTDKGLSRRAVLAMAISTLSTPAFARGGGRGGGRGGRFGGRGGRGSSGGTAIFVLALIAIPVAFFLLLDQRDKKREQARIASLPKLPTKEQWGELGLCLLCGSPMVKRIAKKGRHKGKSFYGCSKYPSCQGIRVSIPETESPH